jgi:predicted anti-sigma-YlaC factor YlaD
MCERAREWASLDLDGELSELERAMLRAHSRRCAACADYVLEVGAITQAVRNSQLEPLPHPIVLPLRRSFGWATRALQAGAATAAGIAVTAGLALQLGSTTSHNLIGDARLPENQIMRGPNSQNDALIGVPKLAAIKGYNQYGLDRPQRGLRIDT